MEESLFYIQVQIHEEKVYNVLKRECLREV